MSREQRLTIVGVSVVSLGFCLACVAGRTLPGRIYSLENGIAMPMEIETSYGHGEIRCDDPSTGEHFEGTYSGVSDGFQASGTWTVRLQSINANAIATLIGDQGTVLDCRMEIQRGLRPHGLGACVDNAGLPYRLQF